MSIQETSLEAYISLLPELGTRQKQVLDVIQSFPGRCNHEISSILGIPINCVTGRVKELRDMNLVISGGVKKDKVTDRNVNTWMVKI